MNCDGLQEKLSAYLDHEMSVTERLQFDDHCEHCEACRNHVAQTLAIGELMRQSEPRADIDAIWEKAATHLKSSEVASIQPKMRLKTWGYAILATAASLALTWFAVRGNRLNEQGQGSAPSHMALALNLQEIMQSAQTNPKAAVAKLVAKYEGKELDQKTAIQYLGYEPALLKTVPAGFTRVSTHALTMPCCKCSATVCERRDGTALIVFEHRTEHPIWIDNSLSSETQCCGKTCKIVESARQIAANWQNDDRQLTLIGAKDLAEVKEWVAAMAL